MNQPLTPALAEQRILVVEDDPSLAALIQEELETQGYSVACTPSAEAALESLDAVLPDLIISDLRLPGQTGMQLLAELKTLQSNAAFLMITAFGTITQAIEALKAGADDFLTKPFSMDHFMLTVKKLLKHRYLNQEVERYRQLAGARGYHGIIGNSEVMHRLYEQIRIVAQSQGPVLITGESGVGKELVAKALHAESDRATKPFLAVNCAGIPAELLESEFFGHVAGAFTGARNARRGLLLEANGGTLLLDEIGEMPVQLQAKLLRALQEGMIRPVGAEREEPVDVRIVAATNRDLLELTQSGEFREDLFYRLETFTLQVPALRERDNDREFLAAYFLSLFSAQLNKPQLKLSSETLSVLHSYPFPGNVRELQNAMERAATFCEGTSVEPQHLPERIARFAAQETQGSSISNNNPLAPWLRTKPELIPLDKLQLHYVEYVLEQTKGNKRKAADILGVTRRTLYRWLDNDRAQAGSEL